MSDCKTTVSTDGANVAEVSAYEAGLADARSAEAFKSFGTIGFDAYVAEVAPEGNLRRSDDVSGFLALL